MVQYVNLDQIILSLQKTYKNDIIKKENQKDFNLKIMNSFIDELAHQIKQVK